MGAFLIKMMLLLALGLSSYNAPVYVLCVCSGIVSSFFTLTGEGYFLSSPCEFVRFSLSARFVPKPACEVLLKDGARPPLPEPEPEVPVVEVSPAPAEPEEGAVAEGAVEGAAAAADKKE